MNRIESIILRGLMYDEEYMRRVIPHLDELYFLSDTEKKIFQKAKAYIDAYNTLPTKEALVIDYSNSPGVDGDELDEFVSYLNELDAEQDANPDIQWLVDRTEEWCQEKAVHNAVLEVINILDGKTKKFDKGMIPKLLQDALAVSFDKHIGHDYLKDAEDRYNFYRKVDSRLPFHLDYLNKVTKNGVPNKTLNICLAGTNVGKSLFMCDLAANYLKQGKNVLYITMEMAEERIAERIDANLMDRPVDDLVFMSKEMYMKQIARINSFTKGGKLIIKEYPTAQAHVGHFRHLLNELWLKKNFKPDAIFIDYLNICASSRVKASGGLYELVKSIAEELRGLAVEFNLPIWSATQMNRSGFASSDPDLTNTSESFGLPATADFMFALISSEEMQAMGNQLLVKILKNRYGDIHARNKETGKVMNKFAVGVDRSKQRLFNLDESAQKNISQDPIPQKGGDADAVLPWDEVAPTLPSASGKFNDEPKFDIDTPEEKTESYNPNKALSPFMASKEKKKDKKFKVNT